MAHFVDQFRFKFNKEKQIVLLSICITEQRTIEHTIPVYDFYMMVRSYRTNEDYSSNVLKMKIQTSGVLLTIRVSEITRRSYNFYSSDFSRLISKFRQSVNQEEIDQNVSHELLFNHEKIEQDKSNSNNHIDDVKSSHVHYDVQYLENSIKTLNQKLDTILELLKSNTNKPIGIETNNQFDLPVDNDMPMFIPTKVNTDFEGKVETKTEKATDDSVQSASNMLKKLKRGKTNEKR